jgi:hypothetical protein
MRRLRSIYKLLGLAIWLAVQIACAAQPKSAKETAKSEAQQFKLVPLGLPQDTVIVTVPNTEAEKKLLQDFRNAQQANSQPGTGTFTGPDSLNNQVYRVQLLTVDNYSDARRALEVAEEIFDLPVSLNYDQPYYKLRVGEFGTKSDADSYLLKARTAGYPNAWVLLTTVGVKELRPMYESTSPSNTSDTTKITHDKHD